MGFEISKKGNGTANGNSEWPKGVYIDRLQVTEIDNVENKYDYDISVYVKGDTPDKPKAKYPTGFYMNGNHAKDKGVCTDWGSSQSEPPVKGGSWKIRHFLEKLGVVNDKPMTDDFSGLNEECVRDCIGRSIYILQYDSTALNKNGNPKRVTWFFFASEEEGKVALLNKWRSYKDKPKNYNASPTQKLSNMWANKPSQDDTPDL
jgi:hypothetical protein